MSLGSEKQSMRDTIAEAPLSDSQQKSIAAGPRSAPPFRVSSLWRSPEINPLNLKSYTLPIFNLTNRYSLAFHLSWLGFFVAFLSWFAFPPLIPEAIRADLGLNADQVANSNIIALCATLVVRFLTGPLVDRYGPRKVMAGLLIIGAIPSGLAGTATNAGGLYAIRFFIGILGGSFVPCVAWTTAFFDKKIVGTANAFVAGWGNMGGGVTFVVMTALYTALHDPNRGNLSQHVAWRASFAIVPVPILLGVAAAVLIFGSDHPAGKWSQRHTTAATAAAVAQGHHMHLTEDEKKVMQAKVGDKEAATVTVHAVEEDEAIERAGVTSTVDVAVNEALTGKVLIKILSSPQTWLPALMYMTSFGFELFYDANFVNSIFGLYNTRGKDASFTQLTAGYYTSIFGFLNLVTRPAGGFLADLVYRRWGVPGKKWLTLCLGVGMAVVTIGMGQYIDKHLVIGDLPNLGALIGMSVVIACFCELANGANFALVPHIHPWSNGTVSGIVGASGNLGGILMALIIRFQNTTPGRPYWIVGIFCLLANLVVAWIPVPKS